MRKPLKLLSIVPFPLFPLQSGGQNRAYGLLDKLTKYYKVTVITPVTEQHSLSLSFSLLDKVLSPSFYRYINFFSLLLLLKHAKKCDVISIDQPFFGLMALLLSRLAKKPLVVHAHNIEYQRFKTLGTWWWPILKIYEAFIFKNADAVFFISGLDKQEAIENLKLKEEHLFVSPYGVNLPVKRTMDKVAFKQKFKIPKEHKTMLFFGKMDYLPNQHAVENIRDNVLPELLARDFTSFTILICGKGLPAHILTDNDSTHLKYVGFVEDLEEVIMHSDVLLNPITTGGGVKTKVLEAIALDQTVVSTEMGALGIDISVCENKLKVVPDADWNAFAEILLNSMDTQETTPNAFFNKYSWEGIGKQYEQDLKTIFL